jgi:hypothetical protein
VALGSYYTLQKILRCPYKQIKSFNCILDYKLHIIQGLSSVDHAVIQRCHELNLPNNTKSWHFSLCSSSNTPMLRHSHTAWVIIWCPLYHTKACNSIFTKKSVLARNNNSITTIECLHWPLIKMIVCQLTQWEKL